MELETHLLLSRRVCLLDQANLDPLLALTDRVSRMLSRLAKLSKNAFDRARASAPIIRTAAPRSDRAATPSTPDRSRRKRRPPPTRPPPAAR